VIGAGQLQNLETAKYRPATKRIFQQSAQNPASRVVTRCRVLGGAPVPIGKPETGTLLYGPTTCRRLSLAEKRERPADTARETAMSDSYPRFLDSGEAALVVEFGATVDPAVNDRVLALDEALRACGLEGIRETVPTYRSLTIHYDPLLLDRETLVAAAKAFEAVPPRTRQPRNRWTVPCCYDPRFAEDLGEMAARTGLASHRLIELHASATYRVYMYGFAPGFCYLGGLPPELSISRRETPRPPHPPNTILVGGGLTLISTFSMPTGWWLIGRTPERMFAPERDPAFLVEVGDTLVFDPISIDRFAALEARVASGEIVAQRQHLR
jgi:inhibitor of KinA